LITRPAVACLVLLIACERKQESSSEPPPAPSLVGEEDSRAQRDSAAFRQYLDSMTRLERRIESLGGDPTAAAALFQLGRLKKYAERWMYYTGAGFDYARERPTEYRYNDPDANHVYSGSHWEQLVKAFPDDSLADDAGWALAHLGGQGECEGSVPCQLGQQARPAVRFLERFPHSAFDSAAVAEANKALTGILGEVADLRNKDTVEYSYEPAPVESLLVRYDAAALRLAPPLRAAVYGVTGPLWVRLGKPERRH